MLNFKLLIDRECKSAYESAYDFSLKAKFTNPKIYTAKGDLSKRWYVYFSFRNSDTNKLERQTPFYGNANTFKTKEERMAVLTVYRNIILKYLKKGYDPFKDNTELHFSLLKTKSAKETIVLNSNKDLPYTPDNLLDKVYSIQKALDFDLSIKKEILEDSSLRSYKSHLNVFKRWIDESNNDIKNIKDVNKQLCVDFLNYILKRSSAKNRNNYRASLSSFFQCLVDNDVVLDNIISKINVLKSSPKRNKRYSQDQQKEIFSYLKEHDELLLLYIKFVAYNFLRPIEVCRLKVGDLDIKNKTLSFKAKNSPLKTKIIPEILIKEIPDLSNMDKNSLLFTPEGIGKYWKSQLESRRGYFTKRFTKLIKKKFDLDLNYTLYSFRHTFVTKLYHEFIKTMTPFQAKSKLMLITGHSTMLALDKYLRKLDAHLPEDYSQMLEN